VVLVFAFRRGGTSAAGIVTAVQLLPTAVVAPPAARLIDVNSCYQPTRRIGGSLPCSNG
jgi:hypothetical protein